MFNATYFTYDNKYSGSFGLMIASFNNETLTSTQYVSPSISIVKSANSEQFFYSGTGYNDAPKFSFSLISESIINDTRQREIMCWLCPGTGFKKLKIHQNELYNYEYNCIFNITNVIYHCGNCVGFEVEATFDSIYHYMTPIVKSINNATYKESTITINNKSDILDDFVYPIVEFKLTDSNHKDITITNTQDNNGVSPFGFKDVINNVKYKVDNKLKIITAEGAKNNIRKFNLNWLRILPGTNVIKIKCCGDIKITCPQYAKIRF